MNRLQIGPFGVHYAKIVDENGKYVKWASNDEIIHHLTRTFPSLNRRGTSIDLKVSYAEKDKAKALGAQWDPLDKVWYIDASNQKGMGDILAQYPHWYTTEAIEKYESYKDEPLIHTNEELDIFRVFQEKHGHNTPESERLKYELEAEMAREHKERDAARKRQYMMENGWDYFEG